jgi:hypothetical protein
MSNKKPPRQLTGLVRTVVQESHQVAPVYMGLASGFVTDGVHFILVANTMGDIKKLAEKLEYSEFAPELVQPVAVMHESFVTLQDDEL